MCSSAYEVWRPRLGCVEVATALASSTLFEHLDCGMRGGGMRLSASRQHGATMHVMCVGGLLQVVSCAVIAGIWVAFFQEFQQ